MSMHPPTTSPSTMGDHDLTIYTYIDTWYCYQSVCRGPDTMTRWEKQTVTNQSAHGGLRLDIGDIYFAFVMTKKPKPRLHVFR
jgi:hypothetical protein